MVRIARLVRRSRATAPLAATSLAAAGLAVTSLAAVALAATSPAATARETEPKATGNRPLLVTVDDLPVAGGMHSDAAERRRITEGLLAALARHHVPAVGFVIWSHVKDAADESLLDLWLQAGHELGSHSDRHLNLTTADAETWIADGERARVALDGFLSARGRRLRFFRFPFLCEGDTEAKVDVPGWRGPARGTSP